MTADLASWLQSHPEIRSLRVVAPDLNGVPRGKRVPIHSADKAIKGGTRFPLSVLNLDIRGEDIHDSPLVYAQGDADGVLHPTERGLVPMPWLDTPAALLPVWMFHDTGTPFEGDPRHALADVLKRYSARGLRPVVAMELEFFLVDDSGAELRPPPSPQTGKRPSSGEILSLHALDQFDAFFSELYAACEAMGIPADTAISESGLGQFEINLEHVDDALKAADDAWLFKMLVKGLSRRHGLGASFMAKPYADYAGSGLHTHFSVLDDGGRNVFDDGGPKGTDTLRQAIAGCIDAMADSTLVFAPHANSFERLVPHAHAPTGIAWAYENRTAAIRVPSGAPAARRIEHRVAGGDANPYLSLAVVLGAALNGIARKALPPDPITGDAYAHDIPQIPATWSDAIDRFENSAVMRRILADGLIRNLVYTKRQEIEFVTDLSAKERVALYLDTV